MLRKSKFQSNGSHFEINELVVKVPYFYLNRRDEALIHLPCIRLLKGMSEVGSHFFRFYRDDSQSIGKAIARYLRGDTVHVHNEVVDYSKLRDKLKGVTQLTVIGYPQCLGKGKVTNDFAG